MFDEKKQLEVKHHAWSDPAVVGQVQRDRQLAERLQAAEDANYARNLQRFNQGNPIRHAIAPAIAPAMLQPIINMPPIPNQNIDIANLQNRLNKVEDEDKKLQERLRNALILENPRLIEAMYPAVRPIYNPATALLNELAKKEQLDQTYRKLKEIYGDEAPVKYIERGLRRIEEETPKHKSRPKSPPKHKAKSRPKSPPKHKAKPRPKSPPKKKK